MNIHTVYRPFLRYFHAWRWNRFLKELNVGSLEQQRIFAKEIARVGQRYWVQTPNRWFPIEPHLLTPFVHGFHAVGSATCFR